MTRRNDAARRPDRRLASVLIGGIVCLNLGPSVAAQSPVCFHADDRPSPAVEIIQQAPPPGVRQADSYPFYPATAFATQNLDSLWAARGGSQKFYFQWANRSNRSLTRADGRAVVRKLNFQPGPRGPLAKRTAFTTVDKANACTLAQTAVVLGLDPAPAARSAGLSIVRSGAADGAGVADASDVCIVQGRPMPMDATGIVLDYEVQDGRTGPQTLAFLTEFAAMVHAAGRKVILLTNPLDAPTQAFTGVTPDNAGPLSRLFDEMTLLIWARNAQGDAAASFEKQLQIVGHAGALDARHLLVVFELANTSLEDARKTRVLMLQHRLGGVMFWRDGAKQGGACDTPINQKIACLSQGRCDARPVGDAG